MAKKICYTQWGWNNFPFELEYHKGCCVHLSEVFWDSNHSCLKCTMGRVEVACSKNCSNSPATLFFWYSSRTLKFVFGPSINTGIIWVASISMTESSNADNISMGCVAYKLYITEPGTNLLSINVPKAYKHPFHFVGQFHSDFHQTYDDLSKSWSNSSLKYRYRPWFTTYFSLLHPILKHFASGLMGHMALNMSLKSSFDLSK